jgi:hypothetical protein
MMLRNRKLKSARAGLGALLLALAFTGAATAAHADNPVPPDTVLADPAPTATSRTAPAPTEAAPTEAVPTESATPVPPSPSEPAPSVPAETTSSDTGTSEVPTAEAPEELSPAPATQSPAAVVALPALMQVLQPPGAEPTEDEASDEAAPEPPSPSAAAEPGQSTVPAIIATPSEPPLVATPEIQAAAAVTEGSPLVVQLFAVLGLLAAGFAYFRFLNGKGHRVSAKAGR